MKTNKTHAVPSAVLELEYLKNQRERNKRDNLGKLKKAVAELLCEWSYTDQNISIPEREEIVIRARSSYFNNPGFHARVDTLVATAALYL